MAQDPTPLNDPFAAFDGGRTFVRPNPAAWAQVPPTGSPAAAAPPPEVPHEPPPPDHGLNPLLALANRLLLLVPQLRATRQLADPQALRQQLAQGLRDVVTLGQQAGLPVEQLMAARYVLCSTLDEAAADTPWGGTGVWARHSLLAEFHNEAFGGEKVFQLMARLATDPARHIDLLELIYAVLVLGFEGRYRVLDNGAAQLEAVRARLGQVIRAQRGDYPQALAQHWAGQPAAPRRALTWLPLAATAALALLLWALAYTGFSLSLAEQADPVLAAIQRLRLPPPVAAVAQPAPQPRLAVFLQSDIKSGLLTVRDEVDRSVVVLRGDGLFAKGSAQLLPGLDAVLQRVGEAMVRVGGDVLVTGHTDNTPMRSARYPSNWHLSEDRARTVQALLAQAGVPAERLRAEGRADGEPVQPNDSEPHRALNRRVELTLLTARPPVATAATAPAAAPATTATTAATTSATTSAAGATPAPLTGAAPAAPVTPTPAR